MTGNTLIDCYQEKESFPDEQTSRFDQEIEHEPDEDFPGVEVADDEPELTLAQESVAMIPSELLKLARVELGIVKAIPELSNEECLSLSKRANILADKNIA
uniref:Uncharacterized protein n=1 Tax=viral metagenome TaxID=1070528 RepID=A0A6M3JUI3_9ZZZZ